MNCLHAVRTENKLKSHEKVCENKDFCTIVMLSEKGNISEFNQYMKSDKMPYITYANIESLIKIRDGCSNNPEKSSTSKLGAHIPRGYSVLTIWAFDHIENKHTLYHGKDCMKKFCSSLREHALNIFNFENKKNITINKKREKKDARNCYICGKRILKKVTSSKHYGKVRDHCHYTGKYRGAAYSICDLKFNVPNKIPVGFHNM